MATLSFVVEVELAAPALPIRPIRQTYQAHRGVSTPCVAHVRSDAGLADLSGLALSVVVYGYGTQHIAATWAAESPSVGRVDFTVPADHKLPAGVYRLDIRAATETDAVLAHAGLLEIV